MNPLSADGLSLTLDEPLIVTVTVRRPQDTEPLLVIAERQVQPGDTLTWKYPEAGIRIDVS